MGVRNPVPLFAAITVIACGSPAVEPPAETTEALGVVEIGGLRVHGDEAPETLQRRADALAAVAGRLREDLFDQAPEPPLDVWLFSDPASTTVNTQRLFGRAPDPPEGFYSVADHAIVVDVSQGDRAPVHFLVHAFMHANFPQCPVWFDEGLAALYEGAAAVLPPDGDLPSLQALTQLDQAGFHGVGRPVHRVMSRRVCEWLEHQGLLRAFYDQLRANHGSDPGGYATLQSVLGHPQAADLQAAWERWLLAPDQENVP